MEEPFLDMCLEDHVNVDNENCLQVHFDNWDGSYDTNWSTDVVVFPCVRVCH